MVNLRLQNEALFSSVKVIVKITRKHSSRMHTVCCSGQMFRGSTVCPEGCLPGGCLPGECRLLEPGGVCLGGVSAQGGICPGAVCLGGVWQTPNLWTDMTDACENITCATTTVADGKNEALKRSHEVG